MTDLQASPASLSAPSAAATPATTTTAPVTKGVANLPEHRHCEVCGRSTAMGVRVCSPECQTRFDEAVKARKRSVYIFVALFALILILSVWGNQLSVLFGG